MRSQLNERNETDDFSRQVARAEGLHLDDLADGTVLKLVTLLDHYILVKRGGLMFGSQDTPRSALNRWWWKCSGHSPAGTLPVQSLDSSAAACAWCSDIRHSKRSQPH